MTRPWVLLLCALTACSPARPLAEAPGGERLGVVTRVSDGDTIHVAGEEERVRLIGIDTPEIAHGGQTGECFGPEAANFTTERLLGERVRLELDVETVDPYGRTLAYVHVGGELFNRTLVERGFAEEKAYPPNLAHQDELRRAEDEASAAGRGLWGACR